MAWREDRGMIRFPRIRYVAVSLASSVEQDEAARSHSRSLIMHAHDHLPLDDLRRIAKTITRKRVWVRYQAVILATQGRSAAAIAQALGCSGRAVRRSGSPATTRVDPGLLDERPHTGDGPA